MDTASLVYWSKYACRKLQGREDNWLAISAQWVLEKGWTWWAQPHAPFNVGNVTSASGGFADYKSLEAGVDGYGNLLLTASDGSGQHLYDNVLRALRTGTPTDVFLALAQSPYSNPPYDTGNLRNIAQQILHMLPAGEPIAAKSWHGKGMWIWELKESDGGNLQRIVARMKASKVNYLVVKSHDGSRNWSQFSPNLVKAVHDAGLYLGAWGYCYGAKPVQEADQALSALAMGADFYVADAEMEFEQPSMANSAETLMKRIAENTTKPIGYTTFALPDYHPKFPYETFSKYADFSMPQVYWGALGRPPVSSVTQSVQAYERFGKPVSPIGQCYGNVSPQGIMDFSLSCAKLPGYSFWDYQECTPAMWQAVSSTYPGEVSTMLIRGSQGDQVKQLQRNLNQILGISLAVDGVFGAKTEAAVKSFQQLAHISVDGIAGSQTLHAIDVALAPSSTPPSTPGSVPKATVDSVIKLLQQAEKLLKEG